MSSDQPIYTKNAVVHIVDDDAAVRDSLRWLIEASRLTVRTYASAESFLDEYNAAVPGCLVLDLRMPGMDGQALLEALSERGVILPVIMISGHGDVSAAVSAMKTGAIDFLEKPFRETDLLDRIDQALQKDALTRRERQVMALVVSGFLNKQVGFELGISEKTVEVHRANLMRKMEAEGIADLVRMAIESGDESLSPSETDQP